MTTAPATDSTDAVSLALVLAAVLGLGLPVPDYITVHPDYTNRHSAAVDFQFNALHGRDPLAGLDAWQVWFAVPLTVSPPWRDIDFTYSGVRFHAYLKETDA
jgi:transposase InsO family protein